LTHHKFQNKNTSGPGITIPCATKVRLSPF
jgi:hypothetical protein